MSKADDYLDSLDWAIYKLSGNRGRCADSYKVKKYQLHIDRLIRVRRFIFLHEKELEASE